MDLFLKHSLMNRRFVSSNTHGVSAVTVLLGSCRAVLLSSQIYNSARKAVDNGDGDADQIT